MRVHAWSVEPILRMERNPSDCSCAPGWNRSMSCMCMNDLYIGVTTEDTVAVALDDLEQGPRRVLRFRSGSGLFKLPDDHGSIDSRPNPSFRKSDPYWFR